MTFRNLSNFNDTLKLNSSHVQLPIFPTPAWRLECILFLIIAILGALINGTILFLLFTDRILRTPFNVYVTHLLLLHFAASLLQHPLTIATYLFNGKWPAVLGNSTCSWYLFVLSMLSGLSLNMHALIAINRTWAIVHPISYRSSHSTKVSLGLCLGLWVYVGSLSGTFWALDTFKFRKLAETYGCMFNLTAMPLFYTICCILEYVLPIVGVLVCFPSICTKKLHVYGMKGVRNRRQISSAVTSHVDGDPKMALSVPGKRDSAAEKIGKNRSGKYWVLTSVTVCVFVCCFPQIIYFILSIFIPRFYVQGYFRTAAALYACQTVVDPILLLASLGNLRESLVRIVFKRCN